MTETITKYYDFAKLFSYNATFNGVCGGRGLGKTFGAKGKGIKDALKTVNIKAVWVATEKNGKVGRTKEYKVEGDIDQFIYLRRYKEELALAKATFFSDIEYKYPDWDFRVIGWEAQASPRKYDGIKKRPWATIGFFVALSVAQNFKSVQFPNVKTIIFDEFIIEKGGQYLPTEATKLMNFYNTVDRYKHKTRVLMLANAVTITNPYFIQYRVDPAKADDNGFIIQGSKERGTKGYMIWHFPESEEFQAEVMQTPYGRFIAETDPDYADYAVGNIFKDNGNNLIEEKPPSARYLFTLETRQGIFSVWYDVKTSRYYAQEKRPNGDEDFVTLVEAWMSEGKRLATFNDRMMGMLRTAFRHDMMRFKEPPTRNAFLEVFKR